MRHTIYFLLLVFTGNVSWAQSFTYDVHITNNKLQPFPNVKVWAKNTGSGELIEKRTDARGKIQFLLSEGYWSINLVGMPNYKEMLVRGNGSGDMTLTYEPKKIAMRSMYEELRQKHVFEVVLVNIPSNAKPDANSKIVKVVLKGRSKQPVYNIPVALVDKNKKKIYKRNTNKAGIALFKVPLGEAMAIDVGEMENFAFTASLKSPGISTYTYPYEPTKVVEQNVNDTVTQKITPSTSPSSARVLYTIALNDSEGYGKSNEPIYLVETAKNIVYKGVTNANGEVTFLLPKTGKYLLNYQYFRDVDVISFYPSNGFASGQANFTYKVDEKLKYPERFLPKKGEYFIPDYQSYFTANRKVDDKEVELSLSWGNPKVNGEGKEAVLKIGIAASDKIPNRTAPVNILFVIDKSGSMAGYHRMVSLKSSLKQYAHNFQANDYVGMVTFNDEATVSMPLKKFESGTLYNERIAELEANGGTNILNGLELADKTWKSFPNLKSKHVLLLSDGYGSQPPEMVMNRAREMNDQGIRISTVGVGDYYNAALLKLIAMDEGGMFQHVAESDQMYDQFQAQMNKALFPIGENAKLTIKYNTAVQFEHLHGWELENETGSSVTFKIGDLYADFNHYSIAQFNLPQPNASIENQPVTIELSYYSMKAKKPVVVSQQAVLGWEPATGKMKLILEKELRDAYLMALINQKLKVFVDELDRGDLQKAKATLKNLEQKLKEWNVKQCHPDVGLQQVAVTHYQMALDNYIKNGGVTQE